MLSRVLMLATMACLAIVCLGAWRVLDAPLAGYVIDGELSQGERRALQEVLAALPVEGILSASLTEVGQAVSTLPWAREISVRRLWPDQLEVTLHKAAPVARWGEDRYLSAFGDLLALPDDYVGLPRFDVAVASPVAAMEVYRLLDQIAAREQLTISRLQQNPQGEWRIRLAQGPEVVLGAERLNERMHRFLLLHRRVLAGAETPADYIDARYANGLAVRYNTQLLARSEETHSSREKSNGG